MQCVICDATPDEEQSIRLLLNLVIHESLNGEVHDLPSIVENVNRNVDQWLAGQETILHLVAEVDGELVGALLIKDFWNLCSLFVHPAHQRKGIGQQLVRTALGRCKGKSQRAGVALNANDEAIPFYRSLGFEVRDVPRPPPAGSTAMWLGFE
ncbi:MAG: GNAT family N-acetyltransferase [Gammaproteobacteria bacterium]|nr:GNAT family N-acetyltransferase [Gammaproteobacteria bacterium]MDP2140303.1 GNAT family N-acetyltransferase [Gammaproteobacteria bacterium]MDP2346179.1 GNAT family N-acetyltransferase [Gammaproteobacteria bacterium]